MQNLTSFQTRQNFFYEFSRQNRFVPSPWWRQGKQNYFLWKNWSRTKKTPIGQSSARAGCASLDLSPMSAHSTVALGSRHIGRSRKVSTSFKIFRRKENFATVFCSMGTCACGANVCVCVSACVCVRGLMGGCVWARLCVRLCASVWVAAWI